MRKMKMKLISAHNQTMMMIITPILLETVTQVMNPTTLFHQLLNPDIPQHRVMPARKRRGKNRKYMSTTAAESSSEEEIQVGQKGQVKKDIEKKKMNTNPPTYVRI